MKIVYSKQATADLHSISAYLKTRSAKGPRAVGVAIRATIGQLSIFPRAGTPQTVKGVYKLVTRKYPYLIYYTVDEARQTISVVTIRHAARQRKFDDA